MIFNDGDRIVFAGDSVTDMGSNNPVGEGENIGNGYVRILNNMLNVWYPNITLRVTNSGISGNTSRDLLERFDRDVISLKPDWVSICIGINDVWRQFDMPYKKEWIVPLEEYQKNVESMVRQAKAICKGVFLMTPYIMEPLKQDKMRATMDKYGEVCRSIAERENVIFIDIQSAFDKFFERKHSAYIAWDRVHPNTIGATLIAKEFLKVCDFDFNK